MAKTKTTTRSKPATAKKTEAAGSAAPDGAADIRRIPLNHLEPSPLNVRKVAASASDDAELLASIRETGIKQNLVVHALSETRFAVDAGGRRLKALKQLAEDGVIPTDHPVPCLVEDERNAILTSATENLQRAAMHPADQFEAFDKMIAEGRSVLSLSQTGTVKLEAGAGGFMMDPNDRILLTGAGSLIIDTTLGTGIGDIDAMVKSTLITKSSMAPMKSIPI